MAPAAPQCVAPSTVFIPVLRFGNTYKALFEPFCTFCLFRYSIYVLILYAVITMVHNFLEMWKYMAASSEVDPSTLHSVLGYKFLLDYPMLNVRLHELLTIDRAFNVTSNFHLIYMAFSHDYASLVDCLVWSIISLGFKIVTSIITAFTGTETRAKYDILLDLGFIAVEVFVIVNTLCPVFNYYKTCNFMLEHI